MGDWLTAIFNVLAIIVYVNTFIKKGYEYLPKAQDGLGNRIPIAPRMLV